MGRFSFHAPSFSVGWLRNFVMAMTALYLAGIGIIENGIINVRQYTSEALDAALAGSTRLFTLAGCASIFEIVGTMALPVLAFLIIQGAEDAGDKKRHLLILGALALLCEVPYNLSCRGQLFDLSSQSVMLSVFLCAAMVLCLSQAEGPGEGRKVLCAAIVLAGVLWAFMLRCSFGTGLVLLVADLYLLRRNLVLKTVLGMAVSLIYVAAPLSFYVLYGYDGSEREEKAGAVFYLFYPALLLVTGIIGMICRS